jgi:hypothetical protein
MESIKKYFRNALIGLATMVLASLSSNNQSNQMVSSSDKVDDDENYHMFI